MTISGGEHLPDDPTTIGDRDVRAWHSRSGQWLVRVSAALASRLQWAGFASGWPRAHLALLGFVLVLTAALIVGRPSAGWGSLVRRVGSKQPARAA